MIAIINFCRHAAFVACSTGYISWSRVTSSSGMPCASGAQSLSRGQIGASSRIPVGYQGAKSPTSCRVCRSNTGLILFATSALIKHPTACREGESVTRTGARSHIVVTVCDPGCHCLRSCGIDISLAFAQRMSHRSKTPIMLRCLRRRVKGGTWRTK